jgi:hypothetical protein
MKTNPHRREDTRRAINEWTGPEPARAAVPASTDRPATPPGEGHVRTRAYELWESAGRPEGDGVYFWLEAERELGRR